MGHAEQVQELDRNMDVVFDGIRVLNATMSALVATLPPATAAAFVQQMDTAIGNLSRESIPLGMAARLQLYRWRNQGSSCAGLPMRRPD